MNSVLRFELNTGVTKLKAEKVRREIKGLLRIVLLCHQIGRLRGATDREKLAEEPDCKG